ncbi:MAG: MlaD family protein [Opitutaceae bacterium]
MTTPATPRVSRVPAFPLVWIVPIIALAVGGWMVFREYRNRGPEITIDFREGQGVEPRKSTLEFLGVSVGTVTAVDLKEDLTGVKVTLRLNRNAAALAREGSQFWILHPEIGLSGVRGLETLLTGARIIGRPGDGAPGTHFKGLDKPPPLENVEDGRAFVLQSERLGSMSPGAPVFYREVKVGVVETSQLDHDGASVLIRIRVRTPFTNLVRTSTRFWNAGGVSFKMNLLGAELKSTSLESLFSGGVAFATPDASPLAPPAPDGTLFSLHHEMDKDWLKWRPRIAITPPNEAPEPGTPGGPLAPLAKP